MSARDGLHLAGCLRQRRHRGAHLLHNCTRDFILNGEDVRQVAVIGVRPPVVAVLRLDQLRGDANLVAGFVDRALGYVPDIQDLADLAQVFWPLNAKDEVRPATRSPSTCARTFSSSSEMPSEKYSWSFSEDISANG